MCVDVDVNVNVNVDVNVNVNVNVDDVVLDIFTLKHWLLSRYYKNNVFVQEILQS